MDLLLSLSHHRLLLSLFVQIEIGIRVFSYRRGVIVRKVRIGYILHVVRRWLVKLVFIYEVIVVRKLLAIVLL